MEHLYYTVTLSLTLHRYGTVKIISDLKVGGKSVQNIGLLLYIHTHTHYILYIIYFIL